MTDAPLATRVRAAHMLAGLLYAEAAFAAIGVLAGVLAGSTFFTVAFAGLAILSVVSGWMEWNRHLKGELVAFVTFIAAVTICIAMLPAGFTFLGVPYVPFPAVVTLGLMLALLYRLAVRSEERHHPGAHHGH